MKRLPAALGAVLLAVTASAAFAATAVHRGNVLTAQHVQVPGTHIKLVPPSGARLSSSFRGFEITGRRIQIRIEERMGVSYRQAAAGLTARALEDDGIRVRDRGDVMLNGSPAQMIFGTIQSEDGNTEVGLVLFVLGDDSLSTLIYGTYPAEDRSAASMLRESLLSAIFGTGGGAPSAGGGYSLSAAGTSFGFVGEASNTRYFTVGGKQMPAELDDAVFTSAQINAQVRAEQRGSFSDKAMEQFMTNYEYTLSSKQSVSYGGLQGIETVADFAGARRQRKTASGATRVRNLPGKGYQVILFAPNGNVYTFNGIAVRDADGYLSQFRRIMGTFQLTN